MVSQLSPDVIIFPDLGAKIRYYNMIALLVPNHVPILYGDKVRDQSTGYITSYSIPCEDINDKLRDNRVLIIDDICDGGMTFKILAETIKKYNPNDINLYVTHGIFSKGLKTLNDSGIDEVFTKEGQVMPYFDHLAYKEI